MIGFAVAGAVLMLRLWNATSSTARVVQPAMMRKELIEEAA
jgi:hypothetical protein